METRWPVRSPGFYSPPDPGRGDAGEGVSDDEAPDVDTEMARDALALDRQQEVDLPSGVPQPLEIALSLGDHHVRFGERLPGNAVSASRAVASFSTGPPRTA